MWNIKEALLICLLAGTLLAQNQQYDESIQAAKISLFVWQDPTNQYQMNTPYLSKNYTFTFKQPFKASPQVALGLYTLDSEYSVYFQVEYQDVTNTNMTVWIYKLTPNRLNQIYIMYFGTDYLNFECVLIRYDSSVLSIDNNSTSEQREEKSESQVFNFQKQRNISDTYITLFLAGIHLQSETTQAGFKYNYTDFLMNAQAINDDSKETGLTYSFRLTVMTSGRVSIYSIQFFYIAYEKSKVESGGRFILNSGKISLDSFGGMVSQSNKSASVPQLYQEFYPTTEAFFFGLNDLRSRNGNIRILGVQQVAGVAEQLTFTLIMQTWQYTFVEDVAFSYLQVKKIRCDKDPYLPLGLVNCPNACADYFYMANQTCLPCHYSCASCKNSTSCETCSPVGTRHISGICACNSGYYQTLQLDCVACNKNCLECESSMICTSCREEQFRFLNPITRDCQCQFGYISVDNNAICVACVIGCSNCTTATTCSSCVYGYFWVNSTFCSQLCNHTQSYNYSTNACDNMQASLSSGSGVLQGKFDYSWYYGYNGTDLTLYMFFNKPNVQYYYYEGGNGYSSDGLSHKGDGNGSGSAFQSGGAAGLSGGAGFGSNYGTAFFDDGNGFVRGYSASRGASSIDSQSASKSWGRWTTTTTQANLTNLSTFSQSDVATNGGQAESSTRNTVISANGSTTTTIKTVSKDGTISTRVFTIPSNMTSYYYMNTGEVNRYRIEGEPDNANYADALNQNLEFRINGDLIPINVVASSSNSFVITARPTKSYIDGSGVLIVKDQGLVVFDNVVGIQDNPQPVVIFRYDRYSEGMIKQASGLYESNRLIVQTVWGVCRVLLFLGIGWPVMPVMLTMQYIFSHSYVSAKLPLNLDYFLRSFQDFRNPSILLMSQRNKLDKNIFPAVNSVYKAVPEYNVFDRGIDFLANNFQFLFTCALSFLLLSLLYMVAVLTLASSDYVISPIFNYFWQRKLLHLASYALVTALPISFFFFGQIYDIGSPYNTNYSAYSVANLLIAIICFGGLLAMPIIVGSFIFSKINYDRVQRAREDVQMMILLKNAVQSEAKTWEVTQHNHPLWSAHEANKLGYLWMAMLYYKLVLFGWGVSFFGSNSSYQLMAMVAINSVFFLFTLFSSFFGNQLYKIYFLSQAGIMIAYEIVVATLGSDRAATTEGLVNLGYLGIGLLYLMWVPAFLLSVWRLWVALKHIFTHFMSKGKFLLLRPKTVEDITNMTPVRERALTGRKSILVESKRMASRIGSQMKRSMIPGSQMLFKTGDEEDRVIERSGMGGYSSLGLKSNAIMKKVTLKQEGPENDYLASQVNEKVLTKATNRHLVPPVNIMQSSLPAARLHPGEIVGNAVSLSATNNWSNTQDMRLDVPEIPPQFADSRFHITTDKRIVMRAVPPQEAFEYIPSLTQIVQHTLTTSKKTTVFSQKHIMVEQHVAGISPQLMQAASYQPYAIESSSMGPRGRTIVLRQLYSEHNLYMILSEVTEAQWQRLSAQGASINFSQTGQLLLNGKAQQVNLKIEQVPQAPMMQMGSKLVLWKVIGDMVLLRSESTGALYSITIKDPAAIERLSDGNNNISLQGQTIYINGGQFYRLPEQPQLPSNQRRLVYGEVDGKDVLLFNTSNGHVVRLEDMTDLETLRKLRNKDNVISTDGETVFVNGVDICEEEEDDQTPRYPEPSKGVVSVLSPTSAGSSKIDGKVENPINVYSNGAGALKRSLRVELAAITPANFALNQDAMDYAQWVSDQITNQEQLHSLIQFLRKSFPDYRYLMHDLHGNTYSEVTQQAAGSLYPSY